MAQTPLPAESSIPMPPGLTVRIETDFARLSDLREEWDRTLADHGGSVYFSYDWSRTWWEFYGKGKELRIFFCRLGESLVGILPIYIDRIGVGPLQFSIARLLGSNIPPKTFKPPVPSECADAIFQLVLTQLLERDGCDIISLGPISETGGFLERFKEVAQSRVSLCSRVSVDREGVHTLFHLPKSLEELFGRMDKDERKKRKYEMRLLAKEEAITRDVVSVPEKVEAEFERFATLHAFQWRDKGKLGHFGSWPRGWQYNLALVRAMARLGRVRFVRILAGGEVISSQFGFVFGQTWFWELPARLMDKKWNRYSLGTTGFFSLAEEAIKEGKTCIEGGIAHYDYKQKLGGTEYGLDVLRVVSKRSASKVRTLLYGWLRKCLQIAYYKIWYTRVSPRLPAALRRPIWSFYLRLDF